MRRDLIDSILIGTIITYAAPFVELTGFERMVIAAGIGSLVFGLMILFNKGGYTNEKKSNRCID